MPWEVGRPRNVSCSLISKWADASSSPAWPLLSAPVRRMSYGPRLGHPALGGPVPLFTRNNHIQIAPLTTYTYSSPPAHMTGSTQASHTTSRKAHTARTFREYHLMMQCSVGPDIPGQRVVLRDPLHQDLTEILVQRLLKLLSTMNVRYIYMS